MRKKNKTFVFDTNVLVDDPEVIIHYLERGNVALPFLVFQELDSLKTREGVGESAQRAIRFLEQITEGISSPLMNGGAEIFFSGETLPGKLSVRNDIPTGELGLSPDNPDDFIIWTALKLKERKPDVVLISKDLNVRLKARALGLKSEGVDYSSFDEALNFRGFKVLNLEDFELFLKNEKELIKRYSLREGEYLLLERGAIYQLVNGRLEERAFPQGLKKSMRISPRNDEQKVFLDLLLNPAVQLVTATGPAGTGKTLLALVSGLYQKRSGLYDRVIVSRREKGVQDEHGFLPGDEREKILPFMMPFIDNYKFMKGIKGNLSVFQKMEDKSGFPFEMNSLIYFRGRSFRKSFIIIDEAQNLTYHQVRTILTRAGEGTKIVFLGDLTQSDVGNLRRVNGLSLLKKNLFEDGSPLWGHVSLEKVERSPLAELGTRL